MATTAAGLVMAMVMAMAAPAAAQGITQAQADEMLKELRGIRAALERITGAQQADGPAAERQGRLAKVGGPVMGKADAPLTLVEFTDLQCPYCSRFTSTTFGQLKKAYIDTGVVRFVSRDFPLDFHPHAMAAARAVRCADEQGRFWDLRITLMRYASQLSPALITDAAAGLKLDMSAFGACIATDRHDAAIKADIAAAGSLGIEGTPSFLLGRTTGDTLDGVLIVGALPFDAFDAKIKSLLAAPATPAK